MTKAILRRDDVLFPDLSYKITGICLEVYKTLGRFAKEKQFCDLLEQKFKENNILYRREFVVTGTGNRVDFIIDDKILLEVKAVPFITKEHYFQTQRYLKALDLKLGLIINFQSVYLKPKRVINFQN
jgi:GxxExxY protein